MIEKLYDLLVNVTTHYSKMSDEFKLAFPEADCVEMRQYLFNSINSDEIDEK